MTVVIALLLAVFSFIAFGAGKKGVGLTFGIISILVFIGWLSSGPGFAFLDWIENPQAPEVGEVDLPGVK